MNQLDTFLIEQDSNWARYSASLYALLVWILAASFFFYKYLLQVSPSVMSSELMSAFRITGVGLGNLAACFFYAYFLMQIPVGILLDKYSPKWITTIAVFVCAIGTLAFANAHSILFAGISRALIGLGASFAAVSCFKLVSIWFPPKKFAFMAGLSMTAAMLGAIGGQAPLALLSQNFGWRLALMIISLIGFILVLLICFFVRDKSSNLENQRVLQNKHSILFQLTALMKNKQTWLLSIYSGLAFAPISVFGGLWGVSFLEQANHLSPISAASSISTIFIGFAIGCPLAGWLSDKIAQRKPLMTFGTLLALTTLSCIIYLNHQSMWILNLLLFLFGLGASCFFLCFSAIREMNSPLLAATVLGFMNTFDSICEALTEPFIGKLLDLGWDGKLIAGARIFSLDNYHLALLVLPVYFVISLILLFFIQETYCEQTSH